MDLEHAANPPHHILGRTIHSRTRIYVSYVLPSILELLVYIVQIIADCAVSYQHFKSHQPDFGWATFSLILVPPVLTCLMILSSKSQWIQPKRDGTKCKFFSMQILQMVLFPFFVCYRSLVRIFWSIEALFHDDNDEERMMCLEKSEECSTCELYHLIQAYGQSAPQIILQLYHMLTQDLFRNFQTTNVQAISLVFSTIDLAAITTSFQRFESQKLVGRHYPWSSPEQKHAKCQKLERHKCLQEECLRKKRESERSLTKFPESDKIMENFNKQHIDEATQTGGQSPPNPEAADVFEVTEPLTHTVQVHGYDETDNEGISDQQNLLHTPHNITDDDKLKTSPILKTKPPELSAPLETNFDAIEELDEIPNSPAPSPPGKTATFNLDIPDAATTPLLRTQTSTNGSSMDPNKRRSRAFSQLETFKDMLLINAQLYIKDNVPRPPKILIKKVDEQQQKPEASSNPKSPTTPAQDVVDFFLPRPTKVVNGIQQEDFAAKSISFFGWIAFICMRMLSLATFCVFFPKAFLIIIGVHYLIMLVALYWESRFKGSLNRTFFYFLLAYVYIFVLLEFRVKFKHIRAWFIGFFLLTMAENLTMSMLWYAREEFESWWFGFIFEGIIYSGILFVATILVYYCILKPKDVAILVEEKEAGKLGEEDEQRN